MIEKDRQLLKPKDGLWKPEPLVSTKLMKTRLELELERGTRKSLHDCSYLLDSELIRRRGPVNSTILPCSTG